MNPAILTSMMLAIVLGAVIIYLMTYVSRNLHRRNNLEGAAKRLGGRVVSPTFGSDRLEFTVNGIPAVLTYGERSRNRWPFTRVRFGHPPAGNLRIIPEGIFQSIRKMLGAQDIEIGDRGFDSDFLIQGTPEPWVREILDPDTRRRISELAQMSDSWGAGAMRLDAGPAGIVVWCGRDCVNDSHRMHVFLDHSIALLGRLRAAPAEGIRIISADEPASRGDCPVCATPLASPARQCGACATPHHPDCWDYFGGCAIFGCSRSGGRKP